MHARTVALSLAALAATVDSVQAQPTQPQPTGIEHKAVACIVVAKYPKLKACFGAEVVEPRAYFHAEGVHDWFWVKMAKDAKDAPEPGCYAGILPKPSRKLIHKHIEYYLEIVDKGQRTPEYNPLIVREAQECKKDAPVAPISPTGPVAVFPAVPAGFAVGGFPTAAVVGGSLAVAGAAAVIAANHGSTTTTSTTLAVTPPPPVTPTTPLPSPGTPPLSLSCQADPKSGLVPLTVTFTAFASGGNGSYDYDWHFGDGARGIGRHPVHTYTSTGTFDVVLIVTSGDLERRCERSITVNEPVPTPTPPPSNFTLSVAKTGTGSGTVTDDKGQINCGPTCSGTYANGTTVSLSAVPNPAPSPPDPIFTGWSGDCSGTGGCVVTMDRPRSVTAQFMGPTTLTFTSKFNSAGTSCSNPIININPPNQNCQSTNAGRVCTNTYVFGTVVKLTESDTCGGLTVCWSALGACAGTPTTPGSVCTLTMNADKVAGAEMQLSPVCTFNAEPPVILLTWSLALDVPGAIGQSVVDGQVVIAESGRHVQHMARSREGEIVFAANLVKADGKPGTWRFEAQQGEAIEPGSLRVLQGDVALLTPTAVVFRLKGNAGEQVAFSYRLRR